MHCLRGGQHVIKPRDPRAGFGLDALDQFEHVGLLIVSSVLIATRAQAEQHDVLDNPGDVDFPDTVVLEDFQNPFRSARSQAILGLQGRPAEVLFAGENLTFGVHKGNATGVQVIIFFGVVAGTADFDRDFTVAERVDDDLGLGNGPSLKRRLERAVPVIYFCHCALRNPSFTRFNRRRR
jgi:hypothetical protein